MVVTTNSTPHADARGGGIHCMPHRALAGER